MTEKYINANSILSIIDKLSLKAIGQWDIDAVLVCNEITEEINAMQGIYIDPTIKK